MIPVSTSVLMVVLKPLRVLSVVQSVCCKGNGKESAKPKL